MKQHNPTFGLMAEKVHDNSISPPRAGVRYFELDVSYPTNGVLM
jgi:hypothetical protein